MTTRMRYGHSQSFASGKMSKANHPRFHLFHWPMSPYVELENHTLTGLVYTAFVDALAQCFQVDEQELQPINNLTAFASQAEMLPKLLAAHNVIGMPVVTKARATDTPREFVGIVETNGLAWLYQVDPPEENILLTGLATVWPIMLLVLVLTGYAALVIWLAESRVKNDPQFDTSFSRGFFQSYWFAYISATTVGYGDRVPKSFVGKTMSVAWILCGISLMSSFTATMTSLINSLATPQQNEIPPLHNVKIGVVNNSIDHRLILERGAKPIDFPTLTQMVSALQNHVIESVALDPLVYCANVEHFSTQNFEFRLGVTDPTVIGFIYNGPNATLLDCMKRVSFYMQHEFDVHIAEAFDRVPYSPRPEKDIETSMFGESGTRVILIAGGGLLALCVVAFITEAIVRQLTKKVPPRSERGSLSALQTTAVNQYAVLSCNEQKL